MLTIQTSRFSGRKIQSNIPWKSVPRSPHMLVIPKGNGAKVVTLTNQADPGQTQAVRHAKVYQQVVQALLAKAGRGRNRQRLEGQAKAILANLRGRFSNLNDLQTPSKLALAQKRWMAEIEALPKLQISYFRPTQKSPPPQKAEILMTTNLTPLRFAGRIWKPGLTPTEAQKHTGALQFKSKQTPGAIDVVILNNLDGIEHQKTYKYLLAHLKSLAKTNPARFESPQGFIGEAREILTRVRSAFKEPKKLATNQALTQFADTIHNQIRQLAAEAPNT